MKTRAIILVAMIAMLATMLCSCTSKEETAASKVAATAFRYSGNTNATDRDLRLDSEAA